jgi:ankyrin repeat protein
MMTSKKLIPTVVTVFLQLWFLIAGEPSCAIDEKLIRAINLRDAELVQTILNKGVDVNDRDESGRTYLMIAALKGDAEIVRGLINKGADVNAKTNTGATALMRSAAKGHEEIVKLLLSKGAKLNLTDENGNSALSEAILIGRTDIIKLLIDVRADVNLRDGNGCTVLMNVLGAEPGRIRRLLNAGADVNAGDTNGNTALMKGASRYNYRVNDATKLLVDNGADVNPKNKAGSTALMLGVSNCGVGFVELLLEKGADVNAKTPDGRTALIEAASRIPQPATWPERIWYKLWSLFPGKISRVPLYTTCGLEMMKLLLKKEVDVNAKDVNGATALNLVRKIDSEEARGIAALLKAKGAKD